MKKNDEELVNKVLKDSTTNGNSPATQGNVSEEHSLTTSKPQSLAVSTEGVPIGGLTEIPMSMLTLPFTVIVQNGTNVCGPDGKTPALKGKWYHTDTNETVDEEHIIMIRATVIQKDVQNQEGKLIKSQKLRILYADIDDGMELKIMSLPVSSFSNWGKIIYSFKKLGVANSYEYVINARLESAVNKKGQQFYRAVFALADKITEQDQEVMAKKFESYGGVLDRRDIEEDIMEGVVE